MKSGLSPIDHHLLHFCDNQTTLSGTSFQLVQCPDTDKYSYHQKLIEFKADLFAKHGMDSAAQSVGGGRRERWGRTSRWPQQTDGQVPGLQYNNPRHGSHHHRTLPDSCLPSYCSSPYTHPSSLYHHGRSHPGASSMKCHQLAPCLNTGYVLPFWRCQNTCFLPSHNMPYCQEC